jgi:circadian clock protein KaiC
MMIDNGDSFPVANTSLKESASSCNPVMRIPLGIPGLDDILHGGLPVGNNILVQGEPGTGKTVLAMHFLHAGIQQYRQPGLLILFEEHPSRVYRDAQIFGWDFHKHEEANMLRVIFTSPDVFVKEIENHYYAELVLQYGFQRIAIDSISHIELLNMDMPALRLELDKITNALRRHGLIALLTRERHTHHELAIHPAEYICDTVLTLSQRSGEDGHIRELEIWKHRGSSYVGGMHRFSIARGIILDRPGEGADTQ